MASLLGQAILSGAVRNPELRQQLLSGGVTGPGITQSEADIRAGEDPTGGGGQPTTDVGMTGNPSTPYNPYAPWMRPDLAVHTQNILPMTQPLEREGFFQLGLLAQPDLPPEHFNPLVYEGFGAQEFAPMNFPNQYNTPKYSQDQGLQQNIDTGSQYWNFAGQEPFANFSPLAPVPTGALATGGSGQVSGMQQPMGAGAGQLAANQQQAQLQAQQQAQQQQLGGLAGFLPQTQPQYQGAGGDVLGTAFGQVASAFREEQDPTMRAFHLQHAQALEKAMNTPGGLGQFRETLMNKLKPTESQYGRGLTLAGLNPDIVLGSPADVPHEREVAGGRFRARQGLFRTILGDDVYNQLLGGR